MGPGALHHAAGLLSLLAYGYLGHSSPEYHNQQTIYPLSGQPKLRSNVASLTDVVSNFHLSEGRAERRDRCTWVCDSCKWQCMKMHPAQCRWNCSVCEWHCVHENDDFEWIDEDPPCPTVTPPPTLPTVPTKPTVPPTFPTKPTVAPTVPTLPTEPPTVIPVYRNATLYSLPNFQGDSFHLPLDNIGDCVEFWSPDKNLPDSNKAFNDRGQSIKLPPGLCVRLWGGDCGWKSKERTLDVQPESPWTVRFDSVSMGGVSAVQRIACQPPADITLHDETNFFGNSVELKQLRNVGDCQELWNPSGYGALISNELRIFNDRTKSIKVKRSTQTCLRLYENECRQKSGRVLDINPTNQNALTDLSVQSWFGILSGVEIIQCPVVNDIFLYSQPNFQGDQLQLTGLSNVGDCVELWSPRGYEAVISDDWRRFDNRARSIKLPPGVCVKVYEHNCGAGRNAQVNSGSNAANDLSTVNLAGYLSSVELVSC